MDNIYILEQQYNNPNGVSFLEGGYLEKESFKMSYSKLIYKNIYFDFDIQRQNSISIINHLFTDPVDYLTDDDDIYENDLTISDKFYDFRIKLRYNISK